MTHVVHAQVGPPTLARSRSNVSRARTRRPARPAQPLAHSDGNHVADGDHRPAGSVPFAQSQSEPLASPFAAAAAASSEISQASTDEPAVEDAAPEAAAFEQEPGEDGRADSDVGGASDGGQAVAAFVPSIRTSTSARQEQDYAIVEAPESLRRPSTALPPQDEYAEPRLHEEAAGSGVDDQQQSKYHTTLATSHHKVLHAVPPSLGASDMQPGSSTGRQAAAETAASPHSAGGCGRCDCRSRAAARERSSLWRRWH